MKKIVCIMLLFIISLNLTGCFGFFDDESSNYEIVGEVNMLVDYNSYLGYSANVTGKLKNKSNKEFSYVEVTYAIYDSAGNQIETAYANTTNLQAGSTWYFSASMFTFTDIKPSNCKLVDVTIW